MNTIIRDKSDLMNPQSSNGAGNPIRKTEQIDTLVIGGGQAGLSIGYQLKKRKIPFLILDANKRVGDSWRKRWDSLRLFTPAAYNGLAGMSFPARGDEFPTKDEMGDFLESYANKFNLPVRNNVRVNYLTKNADKFIVTSDDYEFEANNVVVAMASYQKPKFPGFAKELDPEITQFHSSAYRNPSQLQDGEVLIVGAGNSGSEIGMEVVKHHKTWMAGRDTGYIPFRIQTKVAYRIFLPLVLRFLFHRVFTIHTWPGQKMRKLILTMGGPLIRIKPWDMKKAGIIRVPKVKGIKNGLPILEDGRVLNVKNVIWCTGYHPGFSWIDLPVMGKHEPKHRRGVVDRVPGLYFLGFHFLYAASSSMVQGLKRDATYIANHIVSNSRSKVTQHQKLVQYA